MASENSKGFCTISTADYLPYVLALNESILQFNKNIRLSVLISDKYHDYSGVEREYPNIDFYWFGEVCRDGVGKEIRDKYQSSDMDCFRWSMKPVFMKYLLKNMGFEKIIYVDNDIHFFHDFQFLFDELEQCNVLLSPHWRASDPRIDASNFMILYTSGLYNGGFVGANRKAIDALDWWAMACAFICIKDPSQGQFVDQTHLNLLPIYFDAVKILKHRGCNVANWNQEECKRAKRGDHVLINDIEPIIFIHFTNSTIRGILYGTDTELDVSLQKYFERLEKYGIDISDFSRFRNTKENINFSRFFNPATYKNLCKNRLNKQNIHRLFQRLLG